MSGNFNGGLTGDKAMRVIAPFGQYSVGAILYPPAAFREWLLRRGFIAEVTDESKQPPVAVVQMVQAVVKRGRGRPRKGT